MRTATERKIELYEHLRTHGWLPSEASEDLRREVYQMAWRAMSPATKQALAQARAEFQVEQHEHLERAALRNLPLIN